MKDYLHSKSMGVEDVVDKVMHKFDVLLQGEFLWKRNHILKIQGRIVNEARVQTIFRDTSKVPEVGRVLCQAHRPCRRSGR
jgi:hypothetical protein